MTEQSLPDIARHATPHAGYRLAGLTCSGYGSIASIRERSERSDLHSYAVVSVYEGSGGIETAAAGRVAVEAGDLFWLFPGAAHTCTPGPTGWSVQWATFSGTLAHSFELLGWLSRARPVVRPNDGAQVGALFKQLRADFVGGSPLAGSLGAALIHRLAIVAHGSSNATVSDQPAHVMALPRAVALIEAGALQPLDLQAVADECGIGYSTLRRRFKQLTGQSISQYVLRIRFERARELLARTPLSVGEVAHTVGFVDPYYFSRLFHLKEGLSPTAYRARERR
jgi:AraC family transcriptional regulator, arabinose operon regulatory protein